MTMEWRSSDSSSPTPPDDRIYGQNLRLTVCANQGGRKYMEDRVHLHCQRTADGLIDYVFLAIYDGHGGAEASEFARKHLHDCIVGQEEFRSQNDEDVLMAIRTGFLETHKAMLDVVDDWTRTASGYRSTAGTTASVAFIRNGKVYTGHVGDSAIVLGKRQSDGSIVGHRITIDHKPDCPNEQERIVRAGGQVQSKSGVMRVVWSRPVRGHVGPVRRSTPQEHIPFLAVARALGDLWSYNAVNEDFIVSPSPDTDVFQLANDDACLILGSDGLTNVVRSQFATDVVNAHEWKELEEQSHGNDQLLVAGYLQLLFDPPDSTLSSSAPCIIRTDIHLDIGSALTFRPSAMIRIAPDSTQLLKTAPVELIYQGSRDPPISAMIGSNLLRPKPPAENYTGPGFAAHSYQPPTTKQMSITKYTSTSSASSNETAWKLAEKGEGSEAEDTIVHIANNQELISTNSATAPVRTAKKMRYVCRKHGVMCSKVSKLNADLYMTNGIRLMSTVKQVSSTPLGGTPDRGHVPIDEENIVADNIKTEVIDIDDGEREETKESLSKEGEQMEENSNEQEQKGAKVQKCVQLVRARAHEFEPPVQQITPREQAGTDKIPKSLDLSLRVLRRSSRRRESATSMSLPNETTTVSLPTPSTNQKRGKGRSRKHNNQSVETMLVTPKTVRKSKSKIRSKNTNNEVNSPVIVRSWFRPTQSRRLVAIDTMHSASTPRKSRRHRKTNIDKSLLVSPSDTPLSAKINSDDHQSEPGLDSALDTLSPSPTTLNNNRPPSSFRHLTLDSFSSPMNISSELLLRSHVSNGVNEICTREFPFPAKKGDQPPAKKSRFWGFLSTIIGKD